MKTRIAQLSRSSVRRVATALTVAFLALVVVTVPQTFAAGRNLNPGVMPPNSMSHGMSYAEWSAAWWRWALSLPADQNPFFDETGCANGANGQLGSVWFLTGVISVSGTAVRDCTVPAGKALFFPIINTECSTLEGPPFHGDNEAELRACAEGFIFGDVFAEIDGVVVQNLDRYLVESPLFTFTVPPNNVLGIPAGSGQSVSNGHYLMLAPLAVGEHNIRFGGTFTDFSFSLDISYHLTVSPAKP
jgi:hypothetical protein